MENVDNKKDESLYTHHSFSLLLGHQPIRLDRFLSNKLPNITRSRIQCAIKNGNILVNENISKSSYKTKPGDLIKVVLSQATRNLEIIPEKIKLDIIFEDDALLVVNKEAHIVVHPAHDNWTGTLINGLLYYLDNTLPTPSGASLRPGLVHRIDKGTSGLLVIAKTADALSHLANQFFCRIVKREYRAIVWGDIPKDEGRISIPLGRSKKDRRIVVPYNDGEQGSKVAITNYRVTKRWGYVTEVICRLETGRTHQIRAHMKAIGHPLFGDRRYGGAEIVFGNNNHSKYKAFITNCLKVMPHQALHAQTLGFIHPKTGLENHFIAPLPNNMVVLLEKWNRYIPS